MGLDAGGAKLTWVPPCLSTQRPLPSDPPGSQSWLPHLLDWASYYPSLSSSFLAGKMGIIARLTLEGRCKVKCSDVFKC